MTHNFVQVFNLLHKSQAVLNLNLNCFNRFGTYYYPLNAICLVLSIIHPMILLFKYYFTIYISDLLLYININQLILN